MKSNSKLYQLKIRFIMLLNILKSHNKNISKTTSIAM